MNHGPPAARLDLLLCRLLWCLQLTGAQAAAINVLANGLVILWVCFRFGNSIGAGPLEMLERLGLFKPKFSRIAAALVAMHAAGLAVMALMQYMAGRWLFSTVNFFHKDTGRFDWAG
jgi:hypothetical protein